MLVVSEVIRNAKGEDLSSKEVDFFDIERKYIQKKYDEIFEQMKATPNGIQEIGIMHAGLSDFNEGNIARVRELFPDVPLTIVTTSPVRELIFPVVNLTKPVA